MFWNKIPKKSIKVTTAQIKLELGIVVKENFYLQCLKVCKSNIFANFIEVFQILRRYFLRVAFHIKRKTIFIFENYC